MTAVDGRIEAAFAGFLEDMPQPDAQAQIVHQQLFRLLAAGTAVGHEELARSAGVSEAGVEKSASGTPA